MKKFIIAATVFLTGALGFSQVQTPAASPLGKVQQTVGLTEVSVEYSRPSAKGRNIFGNLVPFGKIWRTGANKNSIVYFGDDVVIGGKTLKKGEYALFVSPKPDSWEDRKSTRLNSSHVRISYAVFCLKKKKQNKPRSKTSLETNYNTLRHESLHNVPTVVTKRSGYEHVTGAPRTRVEHARQRVDAVHA